MKFQVGQRVKVNENYPAESGYIGGVEGTVVETPRISPRSSFYTVRFPGLTDGGGGEPDLYLMYEDELDEV